MQGTAQQRPAPPRQKCAQLRGSTYQRNKTVAVICSCRRLLQLPDATAAHCVPCTAIRHAARQPLRRVWPLRGSVCVAHAACKRLLRWQAAVAAAVGQGNQRMAFGTLSGVVHHLRANAAVLVQPFLEIDFHIHLRPTCAHAA
jgi:hypothetical protein